MKFLCFLFFIIPLGLKAQDERNLSPGKYNKELNVDFRKPDLQNNQIGEEIYVGEFSESVEADLSCTHRSDVATPTKEELAIARQEIGKKCAEKDADACLALGMFYRNIDRNNKLGNRYLGKACKMKNSEACFQYSIALEKTNYRAMKNILTRECKKGSSKSCRRIGGVFKMDKDLNGAKRYFNLGCLKEDAKSCHELAMLVNEKEEQEVALRENCNVRGYRLSCRILSIIEKREN